MAGNIPPIPNNQPKPLTIRFGTRSFIEHLRHVVQRYSKTHYNLKELEEQKALSAEVMQALHTLHAHEHEIEELWRRM